MLIWATLKYYYFNSFSNAPQTRTKMTGKYKWDEDKQGFTCGLFNEAAPKDVSQIEFILYLATLRTEKLWTSKEKLTRSERPHK